MAVTPRDYQKGMLPGPAGSPTHAAAVTPDDNVPLPMVARRLWIGAAGNLKVTLRDDPDTAPVTLTNVPVGMLELWVRKVWATGTTASQIVALG